MQHVEEPGFRPDLYKGTAAYYDRFRLPYPPALLDDLLRRAQIGEGARLLDLACGTGQIAFPLHRQFAEVWAVDQEAEAVEFARSKALRQGVDNIRLIAERAEDLQAGDATFDLIAIGNAFHRLPRRAVAKNAYRWLKPGASIALLWGGAPWDGRSRWQLAFAELIQRWIERAGATDRVPRGLERALEEAPQQDVLAAAGFDVVGKYEFVTPHAWTIESLAGFTFSTSVLSHAVARRAIRVLRSRSSQGTPYDRTFWDVSPERLVRLRLRPTTRGLDVRAHAGGCVTMRGYGPVAPRRNQRKRNAHGGCMRLEPRVV